MATLSRRAQKDAARRATETALLEATVQLLGEGTPFAEVAIDQIVRRAGYSRPTFYSYFRDKRELILRLGADLQRDVAAAADPWLQEGTGDIRPTLQAVLGAFRRHRETVGALVEAAGYDPEVRRFWHGFHERFEHVAARRIAGGDPALDSAHARARAFALIWMTERSLTEHLAQPSADEAALLDELARFWQHASHP
jgi:TetR/AcrR family transcriptional regulator, ethionamide resistance regulator